MFVFRKQDLPADPVFPAELDKLGYFINDKDRIRKISNPEEEFQYKINKNERWNDLQREAMNEFIRDLASSRLRKLGLVTLRLPLLHPPNTPHVPIMVSHNLKTASRIIVVFGEPIQDLGIWAYRTVGSENINAGSAVDFARAVLNLDGNANADTSAGQHNTNTNGTSDTDKTCQSAQSKQDVALVLANTGQLVFHCASGRAMTLVSYSNLPRVSAVDSAPGMSRRNNIPGHFDWQEHVGSVFDDILAARGQLVRHDAKIDVIGLAEGGLGAIQHLAQNWSTWHTHISAMCISSPLHKDTIDLTRTQGEEGGASQSFATFMASRCRAYELSPHPLGFPLPDSEGHGCNCYASGEELNAECIMPKAWPHMLHWLKFAHENPGYCEEQLVLGGELKEALGGLDGDED